jgi:hypothetical protein
LFSGINNNRLSCPIGSSPKIWTVVVFQIHSHKYSQ